MSGAAHGREEGSDLHGYFLELRVLELGALDVAAGEWRKKGGGEGGNRRRMRRKGG